MGESIVTRLFRRLGVAAAVLLISAFPALAADNYRIIEATGMQRIMAAADVGGVLYPRQLIQGLSGGVPTSVQMTIPGALNFNCIAGCGSSFSGVVTNAGTFAVQNTAPIPAGANAIGSVTIGGSLPAFAAPPTVTLGSALPAGSNAIGTVNLGTIAGAATETTLAGLRSDLAAQATSLPPMVPVASSDTTLTQLYQSITASGDTTLVSATSAQSTRIHRAQCSILPTSGTVTVTFKSAATTLRALDFPASGGILQWEYSPYWYAKTANNEALVINFSTAGAYKCSFMYVKGA